MKIQEVINFLEQHAPPKYQESYDNSGIIVGDSNKKLTSVLVCLDAIEEIVDEAIEIGANLIVAHHPIVFSGLKSLTNKHYIPRALIKAIKNDIAIYAIHTNLDNVSVGGVNTKIAEKLSLQNTEILLPKQEFTLETQAIGAGIIGNLPSPMKTMEFLSFLKERMAVNCVKYTQIVQPIINKVALCGGSGRFLLEQAITKNADIYISADFKYHEFFEANSQIIIADIGHYESEQFTIELLGELLSNNFSNFATHFTKKVTNPVNYL